MERLLREVPGVEYVYSISRPELSMLVVRFYVGTKEEDAIVKTYNKLYSNFDRIPAGISHPLIKVRSIDDVPIMALTLWGKNYDSTSCGKSRVNWRTNSSKLTTFPRRRSLADCHGRCAWCWTPKGSPLMG
jgi:multidrug efflux pump subunit AcrB